MTGLHLDGEARIRMRDAVAEAVVRNATRLRTMPAPALIGLLSASALTPVIAASTGAGTVLAAGAAVVGSVGANVLTGVVTEAVARLRPEGPTERPVVQVQQAVAERIASAFASAESVDQDLRDEVIALFGAVDIAGTALRAAAEVDAADLLPYMARLFADTAALFEEFAVALVSTRLTLDALHRDVRQEIARQSTDRERARRTEAEIGRILDALRDLQTRQVTPGAAIPSETPRWDGNPYLGLLSFEERHAALFYGRQAITSRLLRRLNDSLGDGVLLVTGPSGVGKSSLLCAGLMSALANDRLVQGCRTWPRRIITPTADPVRQLATHLADLSGLDAITVHRSLTEHPEQAHLLASQALSRTPQPPTAFGGSGEERRLVLVVDQLEELFTLGNDSHQQSVFLTALHAMAATPARPDMQPAALVVAAIRSDFLEQALAWEPLRKAVEAGPFTVGAMSESELAEAIVGPAAEAGVVVPDELTATILDDMRDPHLPVGFDSGVLPLLSQVMFVMWEEGGQRLTVAGYRRTGGIAGIVHNSAEGVYSALTTDQRDVTRRIFLHLTGTVEGRLTRRPASRAALRTAVACDSRDLDTVLDGFTAQRLITHTDGGLVTIAHEELLRSWARLRDWMQPDITDQALHRALADDVQAWFDNDRNPDYLYRGDRFVAVENAARRWIADPARGLRVDDLAAEFLSASRRRDLRRRRLVRVVAAALVMGLVGTVGATVLALSNAAQAERQAARAQSQHAFALSRQLAAQSRAMRATERLTAERLAAAALHVAPTAEAVDEVSALLAEYQAAIPHSVPLSEQGGGGGLPSVAFSSAGKLHAISDGQSVRLWDTATGELTRLSLATGPVRAIALSQDATLLATAGVDGAVRLWNTTTGEASANQLAENPGNVDDVVLAYSGLLVTASSGAGGVVRLWDPVTGRPVGNPLARDLNWVFGNLDLSPGRRTLAVETSEGIVRTWNLDTGEAAVIQLSGDVVAVAFRSDGLLATADAGGAVRVWDPDTGAPVGDPMPIDNESELTDLAFSPDGRFLATSYIGGKVLLLDAATGKPTKAQLPQSDNFVLAVGFSPDGLLTVVDDSAVRVWSPATAQPAGTPMTGHTQFVAALAFGPDGRQLVSAASDGTVRQWDPTLRTPAVTALAGTTRDYVGGMALSPDGRFLAAGGWFQPIRIWNTSNGQPIGTLATGSTDQVNAVTFSPDGRKFASVGYGGTVRLWEHPTTTSTGRILTENAGRLSTLDFSPDGRTLVTAGGRDARVQFWNTATGEPANVQLAEGDVRAYHVTFSPDGKLLATAEDEAIHLWDTGTGQLADVQLTDGDLHARDMAFSPDGRLLAAAEHNVVHLWDLTTGRHFDVPLTGHIDWVGHVMFSPDSRQLATTGSEKDLRLWSTGIYTNPVRSLCQHAGSLTNEQWTRYAPDEPFAQVCA